MQIMLRSRYPSQLWYVNITLEIFRMLMLIQIIAQVEDPMDTNSFIDFLGIMMDGADDCSELDEFLAQPLENVHDPIQWWWEHRVMFLTLSAMALDYLSVPGMLFLYHYLILLLIIFIATSTSVE
jgi:hAT family C-terminal dimerisation region